MRGPYLQAPRRRPLLLENIKAYFASLEKQDMQREHHPERLFITHEGNVDQSVATVCHCSIVSASPGKHDAKLSHQQTRRRTLFP